jgi:hypothetical protein
VVSVEAGGAAAFSIGELTWYERDEPLPAPARTAGGRRVYTRAHLDAVRGRITRLRALESRMMADCGQGWVAAVGAERVHDDSGQIGRFRG